MKYQLFPTKNQRISWSYTRRQKIENQIPNHPSSAQYNSKIPVIAIISPKSRPTKSWHEHQTLLL